MNRPLSTLLYSTHLNDQYDSLRDSIFPTAENIGTQSTSDDPSAFQMSDEIADPNRDSSIGMTSPNAKLVFYIPRDAFSRQPL
jgi:hypothetical protein